MQCFTQRVFRFYPQLNEKDDIDEEALVSLLCSFSPRLDKTDADYCNRKVTLIELKEALDEMANNKSPGNDGL